MDWDKLRVFHAAAEAGSFTHAGDTLNLSQSAVSRQVSALERDLGVTLFHRHARGLVPTEQGELLFRTVHEVFNKLADAEIQLVDSKAKPTGVLRVTTHVGFGTTWLLPHLKEFIDLYPEIELQLLLRNAELDLPKREADVAIWLREPTQADVIRRPMFTAHLHAYASNDYIRKYGQPRTVDELDNHRILSFGGSYSGPVQDLNWLEKAGKPDKEVRRPAIMVDDIYGLKQAVRRGIGIAVLPDYMASSETDIVPVLKNEELPEYQCYFVYAEEMKNSKRVTVFRDFLFAKARAWKF